MSANGSPVAVFGGARATFGVHDGTDGVNAGPQIQVALQRGGEVDLSDAQSVAGLGAEAREEARGQLEAMQVRLHAICSRASVCILEKWANVNGTLQLLLLYVHRISYENCCKRSRRDLTPSRFGGRPRGRSQHDHGCACASFEYRNELA